jgi:hypothetical protein
MTTKEGTIGRYLPWFLAVLSLGAGGIHFAMIGPHFDEYWAEGIFFAVVAWFQFGWAVAVLLRPTNTVLRLGALVNAAIIGVWAVARTWGAPVGPNAGIPEDIGFVDGLSAAIEAVIVVVSMAILARPALAERRATSMTAVPLLSASAAVAVLSAVALSPSFASGHIHGAVEDGHAHGTAAATDGHDNGHGHGGAPVSNAAVGDTPCEISKANVPAGEEVGQGDGHGHTGPAAWTPIPDAATRDALAVQIGQAREAAQRYPTVASAEADGYRLVTGYIPCIGAHYIKSSLFLTGFDPLQPEMLLYDGTTPDANLVGLSYAVMDDPEVAPEGFAGPNDPWHKHDLNGGLCLRNGVVVGGESDSAAECAAKGGAKVGLENLWMNHTWVVPGWESSWGLFSSEHPELGGVTGNINADPTKA